jgi:hypothetical protein
MERNIAEKILALQEMARQDERYRELLAQYQFLDAGLLCALEEMTPVHRDVVMDYVGCIHAISLRLLELSCASDEKS